MSSEAEPPQKKKKTNQSQSFLSLPDDIIMNCLARISRSHYPKLCLVCKTFRSFVSSTKLSKERSNLGTTEHLFHICLKLPTCSRPSWFTLWIKPNQTLTNDLEKEDNKCSGNTSLVRIPSSYSPSVPYFVVSAGSECYAFSQKEAPSTVMRVRKKGVGLWRDAHMTLARESPVAGVVDKKVYVMGGCEPHECANWAESFDTETQTWEPLPDPGVQLRDSEIKNLDVVQGKLVVRSNTVNDYVYDPKRGKWNREEKRFRKRVTIENVIYAYDCGTNIFVWYDTEHKEWREVKGLDMFNVNPPRDMVEIANYCGKLLILWDKWEDDEPAHNGHCDQLNHNLWCAVIALERRNDDEAWGNIEWANVVFTSTRSFDFVRSRVSKL